jgi:hypothetical protein
MRAMPRDIERWFDEERRRADRRASACASKRSFATEAEARAVAVWDRTRYGERHRAYRCEECGAWHLTRERDS